MEDDTPRGRESISLASVANGLDNKGAELLESLVCPLPHAGLPPTPTWWEGPLFTIFLPPLSPPHLFGEHLGTAPPEPPQGFDLPSPPPAQSSLHPLETSVYTHCEPVPPVLVEKVREWLHQEVTFEL